MDLIHKQLVHYKIDREIGQGGMATIYHAVDQRDTSEVAIKVLLPHLARDPVVLRRFQKEGENGQRLRHPNIARVLNWGEADGYYYMALQYAANGSLDRQLQRRKQRGQTMSVEDTIALLRPVAAALDYAHGKGVLHRDIKPSNVLIDAEEQVLLADFGIARRLDSAATQLTMTHTTVGTPAYMSPEQAEGDRDIDARADIYSLGVMAYEMLTNELPFSASTPTKLLQKILEEPPIAPERFNSDLVPGVSFALRRVLAKDPEQRYASASDFVNALERGLVWSPRPSDWATLTPTSQPAAQRRYPVIEKPEADKPYRQRALGLIVGILGIGLISFGVYSFVTRQNGAATPTESGISLPTVTFTPITLAATLIPQEEAASTPPSIRSEEQATPTLTMSETVATNTPAATDTLLPDLTATAAALQAVIETAVAATAEARLLVLSQTAEAEAQTATAVAIRRVTSTPVPVYPTQTATPVPTRTVTVTPKPVAPECISSPGQQFTSIILRDRPWNGYNPVTTIPRSQSALIIETYQNALGQWFHVYYDNQEGWVNQTLCPATGDLGKIPAANSATVPGALVTPTSLPALTTLPPTRTPTPSKSEALYFRGQLVGCKGTSVGTFFEGTVYVNGAPADGYRVVFRSSKGSGPATEPVISGIGHNFTKQGKLGWSAGYYKHVIQGSVYSPAKTWVVWLIDETGKAISDELSWTSEGPGNGCNYATVNFYAGN